MVVLRCKGVCTEVRVGQAARVVHHPPPGVMRRRKPTRRRSYFQPKYPLFACPDQPQLFLPASQGTTV